MDKLTHAKFNLNNFLIAFSTALDNTITPNKYDIKYSSKRVGYIALRLANLSNLDQSYCSDIFSYAIICKNSIAVNKTNINKFPFNNTNITTNKIILSIINISLIIEENIKVENNIIINKQDIINLIGNETPFKILSTDITFWLDLTQASHLSFYIFNYLQDFTVELSYVKLIELSQTINNIVNNYIDNTNSIDMSKKCKDISKLYSLDEKDYSRMIIGLYLHNLGKLFISKDILVQKKKLSLDQYDIVKSIPYFTNLTIQQIFGFDDIAKHCSTYCEKLDGSGYPYGLKSNALSLKDRILSILTIYQALVEKRSYRIAYNHEEAISILKNESKLGKLDITVIEDFEKLFN